LLQEHFIFGMKRTINSFVWAFNRLLIVYAIFSYVLIFGMAML